MWSSNKEAISNLATRHGSLTQKKYSSTVRLHLEIALRMRSQARVTGCWKMLMPKHSTNVMSNKGAISHVAIPTVMLPQIFHVWSHMVLKIDNAQNIQQMWHPTRGQYRISLPVMGSLTKEINLYCHATQEMSWYEVTGVENWQHPKHSTNVYIYSCLVGTWYANCMFTSPAFLLWHHISNACSCASMSSLCS